MSKGYWKRPLTLRLTAYQRKVLSEIVDGAFDAGACKDGLTKLESNALSSIFMRLIGTKERPEDIADVPQTSSMREALKTAQRIIEREFPNGQAAIDIRNALAAPQEVQDTWLVGGPDLKAMSGSIESNRVIQLHFTRPVNDRDREWLLDAINAKILADKGSELSRPQSKTGGAE